MSVQSFRRESPNAFNAVLAALGFLPFIIFLILGYIATAPLSQAQVLDMVRHRVLPAVVQLRCMDANGDEVQSGSGIYNTDSEGAYVDTNAHVLRAADGKFYGCNVYFPVPDTGGFYQSAYYAGPGSVVLYDQQQSVVDGETIQGIDYAQLQLDGPLADERGRAYPFPPVQVDGYQPMVRACLPYKGTPLEIGSHMYVLGYPGVGDDSLTFTDGVVSGFTGEHGEFIKGSAVAAPGSSGGVTVESETGCFIGFVTSVESDSGGTITQILSGDFITSFLKHLTGVHTYTPEVTAQQGSAGLTNKVELGNISLAYPSDWSVATSTSKTDGTQALYIRSPYEGALDGMAEEMDVWASPMGSTSIEAQARDMFVSAKAVDPDATKTTSTLEGVDIYTIQLVDNTYAYFPEEINTEISYFRYKDRDYEIEIDWPIGSESHAYKTVFDLIMSSIKFR
ncbi:MAG: Peptidase domain protein [Candidatus Adlerbacteria bacterium]|nr:Peptidase domain protein [Candidatus Adlerbacteria bacterium]